jgi:cytochrome c oxidase cbb3-type subunit 2
MKSYQRGIAVAAGMSALLWGTAPLRAQQAVVIDGRTGSVEDGHKAYTRFCVGCHGVDGDGNGENAQWIDPKPRDFTAAVFKCRSTPSGALPTNEDLYNSVTRGFVFTNMPSWLPLTDQTRVNVVAYIKTFSDKWASAQPAKPIEIPPETPITTESVLRGRELFQKLECWKCHGPSGHGDGPSASTLTDSKDNPIRPYNFSTGERFKCGTTNADIYRDFMTGLDGTPMPSFADNLKPDQAWDLVHFLRTLQPLLVTQESTLFKQYVSEHPNTLKPIGPDGGTQ